jgi:hypothetical protein
MIYAFFFFFWDYFDGYDPSIHPSIHASIHPSKSSMQSIHFYIIIMVIKPTLHGWIPTLMDMSGKRRICHFVQLACSQNFG